MGNAVGPEETKTYGNDLVQKEGLHVRVDSHTGTHSPHPRASPVTFRASLTSLPSSLLCTLEASRLAPIACPSEWEVQLLYKPLY